MSTFYANDSNDKMLRTSDWIAERFVGRDDALKAFYDRFSYQAMQNCVYFYGKGGLGKTWLLKKIIIDNADDPDREVVGIIDFFDTNNHSKRGLQASIQRVLNHPKLFRPYNDIIEEIDAEILKKESVHPSVIVSLERQADKSFIQCCQKAVLGREMIFLFDTFERIHYQEAGKWMMEEFLPNVKVIMAIAGRLTSEQVNMPDNVYKFNLKGLNLQETRSYIAKLSPSLSEDAVRIIYDHTGGVPLIIDLVLDLRMPKRQEFIVEMTKLEKDQLVQDSSLRCELVWRYGQPNDKLNWIIWVMAYLKRRFDLPMLRYVIENLKPYFEAIDYSSLYETLKGQVCVKEYPEQESHLLHDEVQRLIEDCILTDENLVWSQMKDKVFDLIVNHYYRYLLSSISDMQLHSQLEAERVGYSIDRDIESGIKSYLDLREKVGHDYDFEEILWGEVRRCRQLDRFPDHGLAIFQERGRWLQKNSRFSQAENHYHEMLDRFVGDQQQVEISQSLGFVLMRQGKFETAEKVFRRSREKVTDDRQIAQIDSNLGQVARRAGKWNEALDHFARSFQAASKRNLLAEKVNVYINRGYLYSLQGQYELAKQQCEQAIAQLQTLPDSEENIQRSIFAWMNLGTAHRHSGDYAKANECYLHSEVIAQNNKNREALCNIWQHLGATQHYLGRQIRRSNDANTVELIQACQCQQQAWKYITDSLEIAWQSDWETTVADGLNRLAKVYREIYHLENLPEGVLADMELKSAFDTLKKQARNFQMVFEIKYEHELITSGEFSTLMDWREKSGRLFDVSALVAEDVNDFHRALDSLTELSRSLLWLRKTDKAFLVIRRIERIKGYDYQEKLFAAMVDILYGDLAVRSGDLDKALKIYKQAYVDLARETGYATYLLNDRLRDLEWRIREDAPKEKRVEWCDVLEEKWIEDGLSTLRPEMIDRIERLRSEFTVAQNN